MSERLEEATGSESPDAGTPSEAGDDTDDTSATPASDEDETSAPTADYRRLADNPYAPAVPETFERPDEVPVWEDDEYLDAVALRLLHHYDLERDFEVDGRRFPLFGSLYVTNERHAMHPSLTFAEHYSREHLLVTREARPSRDTLEDLEALGETLADSWIDADEEHYSTDFTFVVVAEELPEDVQSFVSGYDNRTLLRYGYNGHYEINLVVVAPDREELVQSESVDVGDAFRTWEPIEREEPGPIGRFLDWITR